MHYMRSAIHQAPHSQSKGAPPPVEHVLFVRGLVEELGELAASKHLGVGRATVVRMLSGRPLYTGTRTLLRLAYESFRQRQGRLNSD